MPEHEDEHLTSMTQLLEKHQEMAEVEQAQAAQKEDNDSKKGRAVKKANDEREIKKQKEKENDKLKDETNELTKYKDKLPKKLDNYKVYVRYMEKALEKGEFHEMGDVIARYETLTTTQEDKDKEILSYNNQLSLLQTGLNVAQSEAVKWESQWQHIKSLPQRKHWKSAE